MTTTIQLSQETKRRLGAYKDKNSQTYEKIIIKLLELHEPKLSSFYNTVPKSKSWTKSDRAHGREF
jgi:predicted DNA-binding protein